MIDPYWFKNLPKWIRTLVYDLTGWQVISMKITEHKSVGLFDYSVTTKHYTWIRSGKKK